MYCGDDDDEGEDGALPSDEAASPYSFTSSSLIFNRSSSGFLRYLVIKINAGLLFGSGCLYTQ